MSIGHRGFERTRLRLESYAVALVFVILTPPLFAQLPATRLGTVFPPGSTAGTEIEVTLTGGNLDDVDRLQFSHPGITAVQKTAEPGPFDKGPQPVPNQFVVSVNANVPSGLYEARVLGKYGMSNPRAFAVSKSSEAAEIEPNNTLDEATAIQLGSVINGRTGAATDIDYFRFTATSGQRVLADCRARRIDSVLDATVVLYDALGRELDNSRNLTRDDPLIDFTVPADGEYFLKVFDIRYRGSAAHFYRLAVGSFPHIDFVFPPAGVARSQSQYTVFGRNLPDGEAAEVTVNGRPLQKVTATIPLPGGAAAQSLLLDSFVGPAGTSIDGQQYRVNNPQGTSNPALISIATAPVIVEQEPNNGPAQAQKVELPCEVVGQFYPARDVDWVTFDATKDDVYTIEVISHRLGLPTNANLVIQQVTKTEDGEEQIRQVQRGEDSNDGYGGTQFNTATDDPVVRFVAPADGTYRVLIRDVVSSLRSDPRNVYRLAIRNAPDFRLVALAQTPGQSLLLRKGGRAAIRVVAFRRDGFKGEIAVSVTGLPAGVTASNCIVGPSQRSAQIVLTAAEDAAPAAVLVQVVGKAKIGGADVTRTARYGTGTRLAPRANNQPLSPADVRLARGLAVSVSYLEVAPFSLQAGEGKVYEVSRAGVIKIPYTMARRGGYKANVVYTPIDFPANVTTPHNRLTVNGNATTGEFQLNVRADSPIGTHTLSLRGFGTVSYARNPEAAAAAAERKKELDKLAADLAAALKTATTEKAVTDKAAADATNAVKVATTAKAAADKLATDTAAVAKTAADTAKAAAADAKAAANKAATEAAARAKAAADAAAVAAKALTDAQALAKVADAEKAADDKKAADAAALNAEAIKAKAAADARATATTNAAKPANVQTFMPATAFVVKITPGPVTLAVTKPSAALKQGTNIEIPISIGRLYDYAEAVTINATVPQGVGGLSAPNVAIAKGQAQTKLVITAAANATPGTHELTVRATMAYNGQTVTIQQPMTLQVDAVVPPKK